MVNNMPPILPLPLEEYRANPALTGANYPGNPPETGEPGEHGPATPVLPVLPYFGLTIQEAGNLLEAPYPDDNPIQGPEQPGARERNFGREAFGGEAEHFGGDQNTAGTSFLCRQRNAARRYLMIQNLSTTDELWVRVSKYGETVAVSSQPCIALNPAPGAGEAGGTLVWEGTAVPLGGIQIIFPTHNNQPFSGIEI